MQKNERDKRTWAPKDILWTGCSFVILAWGLCAVVVSHLDKPGEFGDMFGAVNSLFSGLVLVGVVYAGLMQREQVRMQGEELDATKRALADEKVVQQAQMGAAELQRFEATFFSLLTFHRQIVGAIDLTMRNGAVRSDHDCFQTFYKSLKSEFGGAAVALYNLRNLSREHLNRVYGTFYQPRQADLGHYFRNLYHIFKFIDEDGPASPRERQRYASLVRAQLSSYEQVLLFYNGLSDFGHMKFKPLIERYQLLENMPHGPLIEKVHHPRMYAEAAFGEDGYPRPAD